MSRHSVLLFAFPTDTAVHYFICLIRSGAHVIQTQMMSTHDAMVRDSLDFPNLIKLSDVRQNFKYELEIYGMVGFDEIAIYYYFLGSPKVLMSGLGDIPP